MKKYEDFINKRFDDLIKGGEIDKGLLAQNALNSLYSLAQIVSRREFYLNKIRARKNLTELSGKSLISNKGTSILMEQLYNQRFLENDYFTNFPKFLKGNGEGWELSENAEPLLFRELNNSRDYESKKRDEFIEIERELQQKVGEFIQFINDHKFNLLSAQEVEIRSETSLKIEELCKNSVLVSLLFDDLSVSTLVPSELKKLFNTLLLSEIISEESYERLAWLTDYLSRDIKITFEPSHWSEIKREKEPSKLTMIAPGGRPW